MRMSALQKAVAASEQGALPAQGTDKALWTRVLLGKRPDEGLELLQTTGALRASFPELQAMVGFGGHGQGHKDLWDHVKKVVRQSKPLVSVRWAALFHDVGKVPTFSRESGKVTFHGHEFVSASLFRKAMIRTELLDDPERSDAHFLVRNLGLVEAYESSWTDSAVRRLHKELGGHFDKVLLLARADSTSKHASKRERNHRRLHELGERAQTIAAQDAVVPPLPKGLGNVLMQAFGIPPSKRLGDLVKALEASIEAGRLAAHRDADYYVSFLSEHREEFGLGAPS